MKVFYRKVLAVGILAVVARPMLVSGDMGKAGYYNTVSLNGNYSAVVTIDGDLYTWGEGGDGELGHGDEENQELPKKVESIPDKVVAISHSAAVTLSGDLYTWGTEPLGWGAIPKKIENIPDKVAAVSLGQHHSAAITVSGDLYTWGEGGYGALGYGDTENGLIPRKAVNESGNITYFYKKHLTPEKVEGIPGKVASVSLGHYHSAAITVSGDLYTWGEGYDGKLGHGDEETQLIPKKVESIPEKVAAVSLGRYCSAAITVSGDLYTWGDSHHGILGHGDEETQLIPKKVESIPDKIAVINFETYRSAVITVSGDLYTWGDNDNGELGHGDTWYRLIPKKVGIPDKVAAVSLGQCHSAAVTVNGDLYTWGYNMYGGLGLSRSEYRLTPTIVIALPKKVQLPMSVLYTNPASQLELEQPEPQSQPPQPTVSQPQSQPPQPQQPIWKELYLDVIKTQLIAHMSSGISDMPLNYFLIDIDGDGIPELAINIKHDADSMRTIYTIEDNQVVKLSLNNSGNTEAVTQYMDMVFYGVSKNKATGESVVVCEYASKWDGTAFPHAEHTTGELRKTGKSVFVSERFIRKTIVTDHMSDEYYFEYYSSNGSPNGRVSITEEEYNKQMEAYYQAFERNPQATGKYALTTFDYNWVTNMNADLGFESVILLTQEAHDYLADYMNSIGDGFNRFIDEKGYAPFNYANIDRFLDGFPASGNATEQPQQPQQPEPEPEQTPETPPDTSYIYNQLNKNAIFTPDPASLTRANNAQSAKTEIINVINSLAEEQKQSGEALNIAALFIETAVRKGAVKLISGDVELNPGILSGLTDTAVDILSSADSVLSQSGVLLPRVLRTNITIRSDKDNDLLIDITDDISDIDFDNVTIEAPFAAITLNKGNITPGGSVRIKKAVFDENAPNGESASPENDFGGGAQDVINPLNGGFQGDSLNLLEFWSIGAVALILIIWGVLRANKKKLRAWVVPVFGILAILANTATYLSGNSAPAGVSDGAPALNETETVYASAAQTKDANYAIEITMENIPKASVSLSADIGDKNLLVLFNEKSEAQYSKYNPVTDTIDSNIRTTGVYVLKEYKADFTDIENKNTLMKEAITQLASKGIMQGTKEVAFEPDKPITRAEFVSVIVKAFDLTDITAITSFTDMRKSDWFYPAIATAEKENLISGFDDNTFRGEQDIPKQQLVEISANTLVKYMGYKTLNDIEDELARYLDKDDIAAWAKPGAALATHGGIMIYRADQMFAPLSVMTRGDAAVVLYRVFGRVW